MPNYALNEYLFRQLGLDPADAVPGQIQDTLRAAGAPQHQIDSLARGFEQKFDPVTGAGRSASSVEDIYGGSDIQPHSTYSPGGGAGDTAQPIVDNSAWQGVVDQLTDGYSAQIEDLLSSLGSLTAEFTTTQQQNEALRQQALFGGSGFSGNAMQDIRRARYLNAGRGRSTATGMGTATDNSLGALLI